MTLHSKIHRSLLLACLLAVVAAPAVALADDYVGTTTTTATTTTTTGPAAVLGVTVGRGGPGTGTGTTTTTAGARVLGENVSRAPAAVGGLALTGADVEGLTLVALLAIGLGFVLVRRSRHAS